MKIVINNCHGGFGLSNSAIEYYSKLKGWSIEKKKDPQWGNTYYAHTDGSYFTTRDIERNDPDLIKTIEHLGEDQSSDSLSMLKIVEIPDDVKWQIDEYDGLEWVAEQHRTWS